MPATSFRSGQPFIEGCDGVVELGDSRPKLRDPWPHITVAASVVRRGRKVVIVAVAHPGALPKNAKLWLTERSAP